MYRNCFLEAYEESLRIKQTIQDLKFLVGNLEVQIKYLEDSLDNHDEEEKEMTQYEEAVLEHKLHNTLESKKRAIQCLSRFGIKYEEN